MTRRHFMGAVLAAGLAAAPAFHAFATETPAELQGFSKERTRS